MWAITLFRNWVIERNIKAKTHPELNIRPVNVLLENMNIEEVNYFICAFLLGIKKVDGGEYPYRTLSDMVGSIQRYLHGHNKSYWFVKSFEFKPIQEALSRLKQLKGVNSTVKAEKITPDEENVL